MYLMSSSLKPFRSCSSSCGARASTSERSPIATASTQGQWIEKEQGGREHDHKSGTIAYDCLFPHRRRTFIDRLHIFAPCCGSQVRSASPQRKRFGRALSALGAGGRVETAAKGLPFRVGHAGGPAQPTVGDAAGAVSCRGPPSSNAPCHPSPLSLPCLAHTCAHARFTRVTNADALGLHSCTHMLARSRTPF